LINIAPWRLSVESKRIRESKTWCNFIVKRESHLHPILTLCSTQKSIRYLENTFSMRTGLANNRLSWMLTIHGFLYASYAFTIQTKLQVAQRMNSDSLTHSSGVDSAFLTASIWQVDSVIFLICFVGFFISLVALRSIGAAGKANETILKVFEKQFGVQPGFGAPETILVANKLILPTIAGGGDHQNIPKGFLSARWIPVFLMSGWVFSLLFDAWLIWYARM
jgi:hypothetical protein